jgi:hypothetical protein
MKSYRTMSKRKKVKIQDSMGKTNFFRGPLPFNPWALGYVHELLKKYKKNDFTTLFEQNFTTGSYRVGI